MILFLTWLDFSTYVTQHNRQKASTIDKHPAHFQCGIAKWLSIIIIKYNHIFLVIINFADELDELPD